MQRETTKIDAPCGLCMVFEHPLEIG